MALPPLDLTGTKGVGRRKLDAVPAAFHTAFDPSSGADARERASAAEAVRTSVSGEEGSFTTAGARVLAAAVDALLAGEVAVPERLAELALDLAYGDRPVALVAVTDATSPAARAVRSVVEERVGALREGLGARLPEARGLCAWLLLSADAVDDAVVRALATESDPGARAALLCALAGHRGVDRAVLRASSSPPAEPWEQAAAAAAWWALDGDRAPDAVVLTLYLTRNAARPGPGFPWRASAGRLGFREVLRADTRARSQLCTWLLAELAELFEKVPQDRSVVGRAYSEVRALLETLLPQPLDPRQLPPLARRAVGLTTTAWFLGRTDFEDLGLPATVADRRAWLGEAADDRGGGLALVDRWADLKEGRVSGQGPTDDEARAALAALPAEARAAWAHAWLERRRPWPGATRSPNGAPTLLALEQLDGRALDRIWCHDHEPVLSALSVADPRAVELLARIPPGRRPQVWRAWVETHPNPAVALREGLRTAPACPMPEVATALLALAVSVDAKVPLDALPDVLEAMGEAARGAREQLARVAKTAGP